MIQVKEVDVILPPPLKKPLHNLRLEVIAHLYDIHCIVIKVIDVVQTNQMWGLQTILSSSLSLS